MPSETSACPECGVPAGLASADLDATGLRDPATGDIGRLLLQEAAGSVLSLARRNARMMAFLYLQVDGLDAWTRAVAPPRDQQIVRGISRRIRATVRDSDFVARLGTESFVVALTEVWETDAAVRVAHRLVQQLSRGRAGRVPLAFRVGVAFFTLDGSDVASLLALAERCVPESRGRSGIGFVDPALGREALQRAGLQRDLAGVDVHQQFLLHYQPIFSVADGEVVGVEALLRWNHDRQGLLMAGAFVPLAERTGRVRALDQWALQQALRDSRAWQAQGWQGWVSVNLSPRTLADGRLVAEVERALVESGADPASLVLEVTESAALKGPGPRVLQGLHDLGVRVAIDDFGTGYASFEYLRQFDPDLVKLDRVFLSDDGHPRQRRLLDSLIGMAHHMGKPVVVEGVEEESQRAQLAESACDMAQGYFLSRPMPAEDFSRRYLAQVTG